LHKRFFFTFSKASGIIFKVKRTTKNLKISYICERFDPQLVPLSTLECDSKFQVMPLQSTQQRWTESEKLTPYPAPETPDPNPDSLQILNSGSGPFPPLMLLIHPIYTSARTTY